MGKTHVQGARPAGRNSLGSAWKQGFYQAVREAARALGITVSGVHRLRAPPPSLREAYPKGAPKSYGEYWADNKRFPIGFGGGVRRRSLKGKGRRGQQKVSQDASHNRVDVKYSYIPKRDSV